MMSITNGSRGCIPDSNIDIEAMCNEVFENFLSQVKSEENSSGPSCSYGTVKDVPSFNELLIKESLSKLASLKKSLDANRTLQKTISIDIDKIKAAFKNHQNKQANFEELLKEQRNNAWDKKANSRIRPIGLFVYPYFRDSRKMNAPLNEDAKMKVKQKDITAYLVPPRPWSDLENKKLTNAITSFALMSALKPYKRRRDYLKSKMKNIEREKMIYINREGGEDYDDAELISLEDKLNSVDDEIKEISRKSLPELMEGLEIDWVYISSTGMEGERSPEQCEMMWNNYLGFKINKEAFTVTEDERLKDLAFEYKERDWDTIAEKLQTNRTAIQCFIRYQTHLNKTLKKLFFTPEEDKYLLDLIATFRIGDKIPWDKICHYMEGRTRHQLITRYERTINKRFIRTKFTSEEDAFLIACVQKYGTRWRKITRELIPWRSCATLRERYVSSLNGKLKIGNWSLEEDERLIELIREHGYGKWAKICQDLPGRTDNMCLVRASRLRNHSIADYISQFGGDAKDVERNEKLLLKILKPEAPTHMCPAITIKKRAILMSAYKKLQFALQRIIPSFRFEGEIDNIDWSFLSVPVLNQLSKELFSLKRKRQWGMGRQEDWHPQYARPVVKQISKVRKKAELVPDTPEYELTPDGLVKVHPKFLLSRYKNFELKTNLVCSDEDVDAELFSSRERELHYNILESLFHMRANVLQPHSHRVPRIFRSRELVESALYKAFLMKNNNCSMICDPEDDLENVTFNGVDYSVSLATVVYYFIQPPVEDNQFIVLAPTLTTLGAAEVMEVTEGRLFDMSQYVNHSKPYLDYLTNRSEKSPECLFCLKESGREKVTCSPEVLMNEMNQQLFANSDILEAQAFMESGSSEKCPNCCACAALKKSKDSVNLLRQRFRSLFLWPSLLAATDLNCHQQQVAVGPTYNKPLYRDASKVSCNPARKRRRAINGRTILRKTKSSTNPLRRKFLQSKNEAARLKREGKSEESTKKALKKRKKTEPESELRRSKRACALNRSSFAEME